MQEGGGGESMHLLLSILADGEEQARRLLGELPAADDQLPPARECCMGVARQLRCTFSKAIAVAKAIEAAGGGASGTDSPRSADESSGAVGMATRDAAQPQPQELRGICKRRKGLPRWTEKVRTPDVSSEYTPDDGLSWRKYGQKDILGAKFPRSYYRCTYRDTKGCPAKKHVQRTDADHTVFDVTFQGEHTCHQKKRHPDTAPPLPPAARDGSHHPPSQDPDVQLLGLKVDTDASSSFHSHDVAAAAFSFPYAVSAGFSPVECGGGHEHLPTGGGCFSSASFVSPAATTSAGSGYFSAAHFLAVGSRGAGSSELGEVVSAATSSAAKADPEAEFDYPVYEYQYDHLRHDDLEAFRPMFGGHPSSHGQHGDA